MTSCFNYRYIPAEKRLFPDPQNYHLKGKLVVADVAGRLDTQAIYLSKVRVSDGTLYYHFLRFWKDGHVLHSSYGTTSPPTHADAESFYGAEVGYYTIDGNTVQIELFVRYPGIVREAVYQTSEFEIVNEHLIEKWARPRLLGATKQRSHDVYRKVLMEKPLTSQPDW